MSRTLVAVLILSLLCPEVSLWAQDKKPARSHKTAAQTESTSSAKNKTGRTKKSAKGAAAKKTSASSKKKKKHVDPARLRRMNRAFVASADLKPMAQQLIDTRSKAAYDGVEAWARKHAGSDAGALAYLSVGYARLQDKDYGKAEAALKKAQAKSGELNDYVRYFLALAYGGEGKHAEIAETLKDFDKNAADSIFAREAIDIYGNALTNSGRPEAAIAFLEQNRNPVRADVELALGRAYVKAGNKQKGADILRHLYYTMAASPLADEAVNDLRPLEAELQMPPASFAERKTRAKLLAEASRFADAAREYRAIIEQAPSEELGNLQVALGVALRRSGNLKDGRTVLEQAQATGEANAQRLYNLGEIARSDEDEQGFLANLNRLRQEAPTSSWFESALLSAGNMYLLKRDYDKAIDNYRELATRFPSSPRASYTHWKAAWLDYRQGRKDQAKQAFIEQVQNWPNGAEVPAALYWRGRIAEDEKDIGTARTWYAKVADRYRNYYYGFLARQRLSAIGLQGDLKSDPLLDKIPALNEFDEASKTVEPPDGELRVEKAKLLDNAGLSEYAVKELQAASGGAGPNWATLQIAKIYRDAGRYHRALQMLKRAVPTYYAIELNALPRPYWENLFPRPYWNDLKRFAAENGLDPYLVASLIRQESEFNPGALSHANAWGLMQLLPTVGKGEAKELKIRRFRTDALLNPSTNLQLGTRYLKEMISKYNGQPEYALAAYNAGTNRVDDWLANGTYRDVYEFVESIPFTETREYVQAIMRNAQIYKRLYPSGGE